MRYFNYLNNKAQLREVYYICKKIINDVIAFDTSLLTVEEKVEFDFIKHKIDSLKTKLDFNLSDIENKILEELLSKNNVEYCFKYKKYPPNASKTGEYINKLFEAIFYVEDKIQIFVSNIWERILTPYKKIENGKDFIFIAHSGSGYIKLPSSKYYVNNEYNNITSYSCSIFTNKSMNEFNSKLVLVFDVNKDNFIAASYFDSATRRTTKERNTKTLKTTDEGYSINAGYSYISDEEKAITKSECPTITISKLKKDIINEVILDKKTSKPSGLVLFSTGYDVLFSEYLEALNMKQEYNLDLKVINKALYFNTPLNIEKLYKDLNFMKEQILTLNLSKDELFLLLDGYINDVIIPLKLDKTIEQIQIDYIENIKEEIKKSTLI